VGKVVGGDFHHVPACTSDTEVGCVIAYSSFLTTPPSTTLFGRPETAGDQVLCTNPAALAGGSGTLSPFFTTNVPGDSDMAGAVSSTPWVTYPKLLSATCKSSGGTTWLQVTETRASGDHRPTLMDTQSASWGLHQKDINLTLGNLISIVSSETTAYLAR
jgi:hypothetical protein